MPVNIYNLDVIYQAIFKIKQDMWRLSLYKNAKCVNSINNQNADSRQILLYACADGEYDGFMFPVNMLRRGYDIHGDGEY